MKKFKRILASLLAVLLLLSMITVTSFAIPELPPVYDAIIYLTDTDASGEGWSWDAETRVLSLDAFVGVGIYYDGNNFTDKITINATGFNSFDADDRYNILDCISFESIDLVVNGGIFYFADAEYAFDVENIQISDCIINAEGLYCVVDAYDVTIEDSTLNMVDCVYGIGYDDLTVKDSAISFSAEKLIDLETLEQLHDTSDAYPDKVSWAKLFVNWNTSYYEGESDYSTIEGIDEYTSDAVVTNTDISFKVASLDSNKPFDEATFIYSETDCFFNFTFDGC